MTTLASMHKQIDRESLARRNGTLISKHELSAQRNVRAIKSDKHLVHSILCVLCLAFAALLAIGLMEALRPEAPAGGIVGLLIAFIAVMTGLSFYHFFSAVRLFGLPDDHFQETSVIAVTDTSVLFISKEQHLHVLRLNALGSTWAAMNGTRSRVQLRDAQGRLVCDLGSDDAMQAEIVLGAIERARAARDFNRLQASAA